MRIRFFPSDGRRTAATWTAASMAAALAMAVPGAEVLAGHGASGVKSYTGCLVLGGGTMHSIREGNTPLKSCPAGSIAAHFSGGDITAITAGTGLTGGGENGAVVVSLDPRYALPQECLPGEVAKWDGDGWLCAADDDTQYTAGPGLDLDGTEFSVEPDAFARTGQSCASGAFATGVQSDGLLTCAAPPATALQVFENKGQGAGIPSGQGDVTFASIAVPAGTYVVTAKAVLTSELNVDEDPGLAAVTCTLDDGELFDTDNDIRSWSAPDLNILNAFDFTLMMVSSGGARTMSLQCRALDDADGVGISLARIIALKVG